MNKICLLDVYTSREVVDIADQVQDEVCSALIPASPQNQAFTAGCHWSPEGRQQHMHLDCLFPRSNLV